MARSLPGSLAPVVGELELEQPPVVTRAQITDTLDRAAGGKAASEPRHKATNIRNMFAIA